MLGDSIVGYGTGNISVIVDITDCLDDKVIVSYNRILISNQMAEALELHKEPCTIEFDFTDLFVISEKDRISMPLLKYAHKPSYLVI